MAPWKSVRIAWFYAMIRVAEKIGMEREGLLRQHIFIKGEWCDSLFYGRLRGP